MTESFFYFPPENPRSWDWQGAGPIQQHCSVGHSTDNFKIEVSCFEGTVKIKLRRRKSYEDGTATHSSVLAWSIPTDRGAWQATAHGVAKSQTRLSD